VRHFGLSVNVTSPCKELYIKIVGSIPILVVFIKILPQVIWKRKGSDVSQDLDDGSPEDDTERD